MLMMRNIESLNSTLIELQEINYLQFHKSICVHEMVRPEAYRLWINLQEFGNIYGFQSLQNLYGHVFLNVGWASKYLDDQILEGFGASLQFQFLLRLSIIAYS